jgi:hypothetical protein
VKRSTWYAVVGACAVLVAAGSLPRLPWDAVTSVWRDGAARTVAQWPARNRRIAEPRPVAPKLAAAPVQARLARPNFRLPALPALPSLPRAAGPEVYAVVGALGGLLVLALGAGLLRENRRGRVFRMAREGRPTARIARSAGLAQDAVRVLLTPGVGSRRR